MLNFQGAHLPKTDKRNNKTSNEPTVIDETLILKAVRDYNLENKITVGDQITLQQLSLLSLSFKNIWKIENFQGLEKLEKLQLDNNIIQKIENLDHLVNLKWLDLSFNLISEIEGLDKLVNLTDLSLFNNQLKSVNGLDNCKNLNVLSLGNNKISTFEIVTSYFSKDKGMKFKNLQVLNVVNNPFTKDPEYKNHIINSLPNLRYLDYTFIDEQERTRIRESDEKFRTDAMTQEDFIKQMQNQEEDDQKNQEALFKMKSARMDLVEKLSDELTQDEELEKVKTMKGVDEEIAKFQEKIKETVENLQKNVISKNSSKLTSINKFEQAVRVRIAKSEQETIYRIKVFEKKKKLAFRAKEKDKYGQDKDSNWREQLDDLFKETNVLKDDLLQIELSLMLDMETAINDFDSRLAMVAKEMQDYVSGDHGFKKILEAIREFGQKLNDIAKLELERFMLASNNQQDISEWDDELQGLFENKETLLGTVSNIKDNLTQKANTKDGNITSQIDRDVKLLTNSYKETQYERNRKNVNQIHNQIEEYRKMINELQAASDDDSDN